MNLKKSKTSVRKLFWALCILGSGIHVHAVESSTETINTDGAATLNAFLRPNSVEEANDRFLEASRKGCVELMERLIKDVPEDRQVTPETVQSAFDDAAYAEGIEGIIWPMHEKVMEWILSKAPKGLGVTAPTVDNALLAAAENGRAQTVKYLLSQKHVNIDQQVLRDAFGSAAWKGHTNIMKQLLELNDGPQVTPENVEGILLWAACYRQENVMNWLLREVNDTRKVTPEAVQKAFKWAAWKGHTNIMELLGLNDGPQATPETVQSAFDDAVYAESIEVINWLLNKVPDKVTAQIVGDALLAAAENGRAQTVKYLLSHNRINIDQQVLQDAFGNAAWKGHTNIMKQLLELNDGPQVTLETVELVLTWAARYRQENVMNWLLREVNVTRKVTPEAVNRAFCSAARYGHTNIMEQLLGLNDGPQVPPETVEMILTCDAENGRAKTVKYLLSQKHVNIGQPVLQDAFNVLESKMNLEDLAEFPFPKEVYQNSQRLNARLDQISEEELKAIMAIRTKNNRNSLLAEYFLNELLEGKQSISQKNMEVLLKNSREEFTTRGGFVYDQISKKPELKGPGWKTKSKNVMAEILTFLPNPRIQDGEIRNQLRNKYNIDKDLIEKERKVKESLIRPEAQEESKEEFKEPENVLNTQKNGVMGIQTDDLDSID